MTGHEFIKVYDEQFNIADLRELLSAEPRPETTLAVQRRAKALFTHYRFVLPSVAGDVSSNDEDCKLTVVDPEVVGPFHATATMEGRRVILSLIVFLSSSRNITFPLQGITFQGRPGRAVVLPGNWTHPFLLGGRGNLVMTQQQFVDVPSGIGDD